MEADDYAGGGQDSQSSKKEMKKRLKEMEDEAGALREMQAKVEKEMADVQEDSSGGAASHAEKEEVDSRSIYVGNVDHACTPEEVQQHFQSCGTVNRVTIKTFAYVEFVEVEAVQNALLLNESELHGRRLKVSAKRTNNPGMKQYRGRRPNPYMTFGSRRPYMPPPFYYPYGYGYKEQAKQRQLEGILNKLRPQNFGELFQQVIDVNIDNTTTLSGVVAQIFDKALTEPTLCEMYANFCFHLSGVLPDFTENNERITFKRLLLNKCQEEFERRERQQAEADRVEEEGGIKQSDEEREENRIKARRRMLGNIRLIGELYKKKMLTERIMHECILKLLGQHENPDEEDLESLCKLMSTIGDQIDHAKAKVHMDAYFNRMMKLLTNQKLSSRVRFMLREVIDLRKNRWQQRKKVEGPKKIEEVHRDAAQERQIQASRLTRGPSMSSNSRIGSPGDYGPRGSSVLPSPNSQIGGLRGLPTQACGYGMQDALLADHHPLENRTLSLPLTEIPFDDSSITLGPQGGLARGMSIRGQPSISSVPLAENPLGIGDSRRMMSGPNGYNATNDRMPYRPRRDVNLGNMPDRSSETSFDQQTFQDRNVTVGNWGSRVAALSYDRFSPTIFPAGRTLGSLGGNLSVASDAKPLSEEVLREKSISTIREFYCAKDECEVALCIKELNSPSFYPFMVSLWVTDSFERKDMERDLLATLLVNLTKSQDNLFNQLQLTQGFESVLASLEDAVNDAPRAAEFLGRILVKVILENVVPLSEIGKLIHEGGEESGRLLESGLASEVLGSILEIIKIEKGDSKLKAMISSSKLRLEDFKPPHPIKSKKLDAFL